MVDWDTNPMGRYTALPGRRNYTPPKKEKKSFWEQITGWIDGINERDRIPYQPVSVSNRRGGGGSIPSGRRGGGGPIPTPSQIAARRPISSEYLDDDGSMGVADYLRQQALSQQAINVPMPSWDPEGMAAAEFDPQLQALLAARAELESRGERNRNMIGQLFSSLATGIRGDAPSIDQNYDEAGANIGSIFDQAQQSVSNTYDKSAAEQEAMMRRLGIEEAAPGALEQGTEDESFFTSLLANNKANNQTLLDTLQANAQTANTGYAQAAELGGTNRQADLTAQLQSMLGEFDQNRMSLEGQKAGRAAELARQLEQLQYDRGMDSYQINRQSMMDQASMMQQQQEALAASQPNFDDQWKTMSPTEKVMYKADELTGGQADVYYNFIRNVIDNDPDILTGRPSASQVSNKVRAANRDGRLNSAFLDNLARYMVDVGAI